jgi:hypothetical protein
MTFFDITLRTEASLHAHGEPDQFISEHTLEVFADPQSD